MAGDGFLAAQHLVVDREWLGAVSTSVTGSV